MREKDFGYLRILLIIGTIVSFGLWWVIPNHISGIVPLSTFVFLVVGVHHIVHHLSRQGPGETNTLLGYGLEVLALIVAWPVLYYRTFITPPTGFLDNLAMPLVWAGLTWLCLTEGKVSLLCLKDHVAELLFN